MRRSWCLRVAAVLLAGGCGGKEASPPAGETPAKESAGGSSGNPLTAPADYVGAVVGARKSAERTVDLIQVRQAIQLFQAGEERLPTSLQELVSEGYLPRLPDPPSGQRFEYDGRLGQVKLVPAPAGR